jgi:hypothetical protein
VNTTNPTQNPNPNTPTTPNPGRQEPQQPPDQSNLPNRNRRGTADVPGQAGPGATESETGDRTGPAVGYNQEPQREEDEGGVS